MGCFKHAVKAILFCLFHTHSFITKYCDRRYCDIFSDDIVIFKTHKDAHRVSVIKGKCHHEELRCTESKEQTTIEIKLS